jgi:hypothetical protein
MHIAGLQVLLATLDTFLKTAYHLHISQKPGVPQGVAIHPEFHSQPPCHGAEKLKWA